MHLASGWKDAEEGRESLKQDKETDVRTIHWCLEPILRVATSDGKTGKIYNYRSSNINIFRVHFKKGSPLKSFFFFSFGLGYTCT